MQLDYHTSTGAFTLKIPRTESGTIQTLMRENGFDFSLPASTPDTACLFTTEPYCAASFSHCATPKALAELRPILTQIEASWKNESKANIACPADQELWPFQKCNIEYALSRKCTLIGDQPGLGKTPTAVCFANEIRAKRTLVICPASIRLQWVQKIRDWTILRWPYCIHPILAGRHGVHPTAEWTVVSYDLARTEAIGKALAKGHYDLLILDEAHFCQTSDSLRSCSIFGGDHAPLFEYCAARSERILALTGTPLPARPRNAYTLAKGLCWDAIDHMSEGDFQERFNPSQTIEKFDAATGKTKIYIDERSGRHSELQNRLRANFMIRHLKREVMPQLKMPIYDLIHLEETAAVKQVLKAESLLDIDIDHIDSGDFKLQGAIATVRRMMGVALAPQVADYIDMCIDGGEEKLVVFAYHHEVLDILQKAWERHGLIRVDGHTSAQNKIKSVELFQKDPKKQIFLGQIVSCGTGTDGLQTVSAHAFIAEPDWNPGPNEQAFDRLDRGGQTRCVQGDIFVVQNSIAAKILASSLRKGQVIHAALDKRYIQ